MEDKETTALDKLATERKAASELQERRHEDWNDNYELYRNKVHINRLTQRQAVNIPLMKETVKTLLSSIDEPPEVEWKELGGNEQKELYYQEIWNNQFKDNKLELIDMLDKKNVLLYGFSVKKLNIGDGGVEIDVLDPYDILLDPLAKPWDIETNRFIIHRNIFRCVRDILADDRYSDAGKAKLKIWADTSAGITQSEDNREAFEKKMERLAAMGVDRGEFKYFAAGDRVVNLTEHFSKIWNTEIHEFERRVFVYAEDSIELADNTLKELLGVDFWPFTMWSEDLETTDTYPDAVADLVRTPNKVLNVWYSQLIENRTLKNFQMHWYLPGQNYTPQTYTPGPGVMLAAPPGDDIRKVIQPVEISGLDDTLAAINAITNIVERGSGVTAIDKGIPESGQQTLGEVEILVGKAQERAVGMSKYYRLSWYETAKKWDALMHANAPKILKLYRTARSGRVYPKAVLASEWKSADGYMPVVKSSSEREADSIKGLQKWQYILERFPNNLAILKIAQKRMLELVDISPEELRDIEAAEEQMQQIRAQQAQLQQAPQEVPQQVQQQAPQNQDAEEVARMVQELATITG